MNKILLTSLFLSFSGLLASQQAINIQEKMQEEQAMMEEAALNAKHEPLKIPSNPPKKDGEAEIIYLGTSGNIYTILLSGNNQVSYNPDLDAVMFIHRKDAAAPLNGVMEFDYSTDGGSSWEVNQGPLSPTFDDGTETGINGLRFPNGVLWAPEGTTDASEAYVVGHGPAHDTETNNSAWGNLFEVSSKLDGSNVSEKYTNFADSIEGLPSDFHPYNTAQVGDDIWSLSTQINTTADISFDTLSYRKFYLSKATFNYETNSFDYVLNNVFEPNWIVNDDGDGSFSNFYQTHTMAWDNSGLVGYVVLIGGRESEFGYVPVPKPFVWKTVDGGENWSELQEFDFQTLDAMQNNLADAIGGTVVRPYFTTTDATVDMNGELNLFSHVLSGFTNHPDSAGFIFSDPSTEFFYHCKTNGETDWEANVITEVVNSDAAADFSLGDQPLRFKPQISKTPDGSKIFFSYHKAMDNLILTTADIYARGYDVETEIYAHEKNLTEGTDYEEATFYQTMAPICKVNGECHAYELPIVFIEPSTSSQTPDLESCQHIYLYGAGFDDINFDPASVSDIQNEVGLDVYPNPSDGHFIISLPNDVSGTLQIFDISGKMIFENQNQMNQISLDLTDQPAGTYTIRYFNENIVRTSSLIIR